MGAATLLALAAAAHAAPPAEWPGLYRDGVAALQKGAFDTAIDQFERLSDSGFVHPDSSYNRGAAYVQRARSLQQQPGDLGRAAAGFAEALALRPGDEGAELALEQVRSEIARRSVRAGGKPIEVSPSMARVLVGLLPEPVLLGIAVLGSLGLTVGLFLRAWSSRSSVRLGGMISVWLGALFLSVGMALALSAGYYRRGSQLAVVVVREARLLDARGLPLERQGGIPEQLEIPEGAAVWVVGRQQHLAQVEWGTTRAWIDASRVRVLAQP